MFSRSRGEKKLKFSMDLRQLYIRILIVGSLALMATSKILDVRLVGGSKRREGTVEFTQDGITWNTSCGRNLGFVDVTVICRQLGFNGANHATVVSPFQSTQSSPRLGLQCTGGESSLQECETMTCLSPNTTAGAANCYDGRYIGCYEDNGYDHMLPVRKYISNQSLSIDTCIDMCTGDNSTNFAFAGVENGMECYCGSSPVQFNQYPKGTDSDCNIICARKMSSTFRHTPKQVYAQETPTTELTKSSYTLELSSLTATYPQHSPSPHRPTYTVEGLQQLYSTTVESSNTSGVEVSPLARATVSVPKHDSPNVIKNTGLYAGAGGGATAVLVLLVIISSMVGAKFKRKSSGKKDEGVCISMNDRDDIGGIGSTSDGIYYEIATTQVQSQSEMYRKDRPMTEDLKTADVKIFPPKPEDGEMNEADSKPYPFKDDHSMSVTCRKNGSAINKSHFKVDMEALSSIPLKENDRREEENDIIMTENPLYG